MRRPKLTPEQFDNALSVTRMRGRTIGAARAVLVDGMTQQSAGVLSDVSWQAVSRAVQRILRAHGELCGACPLCGHRHTTDALAARHAAA